MGVGYVSIEMMQKQFGSITSDDRVLMCGPPAMIKACVEQLKTLGVPDDSVFRF